MPELVIYQQTQKIYIDDSIMPWRNNLTHILSTWYGKTRGYQSNEFSINSYGIFTFISAQPGQELIFREYKKLDWLLGLIGGGIFLLFIFFYIPCRYISELKDRKKICESLLILKERNYIGEQSLYPPAISNGWYFYAWLPSWISCGKRDRKLIEISDRVMDIATVIKKQKVSLRNIRRFEKSKRRDISNIYNIKRELVFEKKKLEFQNQSSLVMDDEYIKKLEFPNHVFNTLQKDEQIPEIYENNAIMLTLNNSELAEKRLGKL